MTFRGSVCVLLMALMCMAAPAAAQDASTAAGAAPMIGVVDPGKVFANMQEVKDFNERQELQRRKTVDEERQRTAEIQRLQSERNQLKPDTAQYRDKNRELRDKSVSLKIWREAVGMDIASQNKEELRRIFGKIEAAVAEVAQQRKLDLVIADQSPELPPDMESISMEQLRNLILRRNILYSSGKFDITNDVLNLLDARYKEGK